MALLANSPPKVARIPSLNAKKVLPLQGITGQYDEFQYTELEFLGPTEFDDERDERDEWTTGRDDGNNFFIKPMHLNNN